MSYSRFSFRGVNQVLCIRRNGLDEIFPTVNQESNCAVRFTIDRMPPLDDRNPHCKNCQRQIGTAFSILVAVPEGALSMEGAQPDTYQDVGRRGLPVLRRFCSKCGSPVFSEVTATQTMDWIKVGISVTYLGFSQRSTSGATRRNPLDSEAEAVNYGFADEPGLWSRPAHAWHGRCLFYGLKKRRKNKCTVQC